MKVTNNKNSFKHIQKVNGGYTVNFEYKDVVEYLPSIVNDELVISDKPTETNMATWVSIFVNHKPSQAECKSIITKYYNDITTYKIVNQMVWNGYNVPLSTTDQSNYKALCDLAIQTDGKSLPAIVKFSNGVKAVYYTFTNVEDILDFWSACVKHINDCLAEGWKKKEAINYNNYND